MPPTTQKINAAIDAVVSTLKADSTLTDMLGNGSTSVIKHTKHDEGQTLKALQNNPDATSPLLIAGYIRSKFDNEGNTHTRTLSLFVSVIVSDPRGYPVRADAAYPVMDQVITTLLETPQLGLSSPLPDLILPVGDQYIGEILDDAVEPLSISQWLVEFSIAVEWQT